MSEVSWKYIYKSDSTAVSYLCWSYCKLPEQLESINVQYVESPEQLGQQLHVQLWLFCLANKQNDPQDTLSFSGS